MYVLRAVQLFGAILAISRIVTAVPTGKVAVIRSDDSMDPYDCDSPYGNPNICDYDGDPADPPDDNSDGQPCYGGLKLCSIASYQYCC